MKYLYRFAWYFLYIYWFIRRPHVLGSGVIIESDGAVLLVRHTYGHRRCWYFPGGGKKKDEDAQTAAKRELKEELGLESKLQLLGRISGIEDRRHITDTYYFGTVTNAVVVKDNKEIADYKWWPKDALPDNLSALSKLAAGQFISH